MARSARTLIRAALGAAVVAVLGLGAAEAFAVPPGGAATVARTCHWWLCDKDCRDAGSAGGACINGECSCA